MENTPFNDPARVQRLLLKVIDSIKHIESRLNSLSPVDESSLLINYDYYHIADLTRIFGVHKNTIYRYMQAGIIPYSKVGKKVIFLKKDIQALIEQNYVDISE